MQISSIAVYYNPQVDEACATPRFRLNPPGIESHSYQGNIIGYLGRPSVRPMGTEYVGALVREHRGTYFYPDKVPDRNGKLIPARGARFEVEESALPDSIGRLFASGLGSNNARPIGLAAK